MRAIGLLGGTFNPIHFGHLRMAQELAESLPLEAVRFIPAKHPPHKTNPHISAEHRVAMVRLAIADNPLFTVDTQELQRAGASYTIDTLKSLRSEMGNQTSFVLMMGSDSYAQLDTWKQWEALLEHTHIAIVERPYDKPLPLSDALNTYLAQHLKEDKQAICNAPAGFIIKQRITALDISSTAIRHALLQHHSIRYLVPESVIDYIQSHQLYL